MMVYLLGIFTVRPNLLGQSIPEECWSLWLLPLNSNPDLFPNPRQR